MSKQWNNQPRKGPAPNNRYDRHNEPHFTDFPNNPHVYDNTIPNQYPNYHENNNYAYPQYGINHQPNNFAPHGQNPTSFNPNPHHNGTSGHGEFIMEENGFGIPPRSHPSNGINDQNPQRDTSFGGFADDPGFTVPATRRPGNGGNSHHGMGNHRNMRGPRGFGGGYK